MCLSPAMATSIARLKHLLQLKRRLGVIFDTFLAATASAVDRVEFKRELLSIFSLLLEEGPIVKTASARSTRNAGSCNGAMSNGDVVACICQMLSKVLKHGRNESHPERRVGKSSNASSSAAESSSHSTVATISDLQIDAVEMFIGHFDNFAGYMVLNTPTTDFKLNEENNSDNERFFSQKAFFLKCLTDISKFFSSRFYDMAPPLPLLSAWLTRIDEVLQSALLDIVVIDDEIVSSDCCIYYTLRILKLLKAQCTMLDLVREKLASSSKKRKHVDGILANSPSSDEKYLDVTELVQRLHCIYEVTFAVIHRTLLDIKINRQSGYIVGDMSLGASISGISSSIFSGENILVVIVAMSFHVSAKLFNVTARARQLLHLSSSNGEASASNLLHQQYLILEGNVARLMLGIKGDALDCASQRSDDSWISSSSSSSSCLSRSDYLLFCLFDRCLAVDDTTLAGALVEISDFRGHSGLLKPREAGDAAEKSRPSDLGDVSKEQKLDINCGSSSESIQRSRQDELQETFSCTSLFLYYLHSMEAQNITESSKNRDFYHRPKNANGPDDASGNVNIDVDDAYIGGNKNACRAEYDNDNGECGDEEVEEYDDELDDVDEEVEEYDDELDDDELDDVNEDDVDENDEDDDDNYDVGSFSGLYIFLSSSGDTNLLLFVLRALKSLSACSGNTERLYNDFYLARQLAKLKEQKCEQMARSFQEDTVVRVRRAGAIVYAAGQIDVMKKSLPLVMVDDDISRQIRLELGLGNVETSRVVIRYQDMKYKDEEVEIEEHKRTFRAEDNNKVFEESGLQERGRVNLGRPTSSADIYDDGAKSSVDSRAFYRRTAVILTKFEGALLRAARRESKAHEEGGGGGGEETARLFFNPMLLLGPLSAAITVVGELFDSTK